MDNCIGIYKITNVISGKVYIGASLRVARRLSDHFAYLRAGKHPNRTLQEDFKKDGRSSFVSEILEKLETDDLKTIHERELYYYNIYKENIYNKREPLLIKRTKQLEIPDAPKLRNKFLARAIPSKGCWDWRGTKCRDGYATISYRGKVYRASRVSYFIYFNKQPGDMLLCHKCDNPICCNPKHLFLGTNQDNSDDKVKKGRVGLQHIDWELINRIRDEYKRTETSLLQLGNKYSIKNINAIVKNHVWKDANYVPPTEKEIRERMIQSIIHSRKLDKERGISRRKFKTKLFSTAHLAKIIGVKPSTVCVWCRTGRLKDYTKVGSRYKFTSNQIVNIRFILFQLLQ